MGKPAARMGDTTAHGGTIAVGNPSIMIGKMAVATLGDMHVCPMCTPAVPPIPHVGGPILLGSMGVMIGKKPAARLSDSALCVGPPSMPAMGCMTVLIGEIGSGSQAGSAGSAAAALAAKSKGPKAIEPFPVADPPEKPPENHTVECEFVDSAGKLLQGILYKIKDPDNNDILGVSTTDGKAYHEGYAKSGSFSLEVPAISEVKWEKAKGGIKDKIKYSAKVDGFDDGSPAFVTLIEVTGITNRTLEFLPCKVTGGKIEGEWQWKKTYLSPVVAGESHGAPVYFFQVVVGCLSGRSEALTIADTLKVKVTDPEGKAVKDRDYKLYLPSGEVVSGKVDSSGTVTRENVPPGRHKIILVDPKHKEKAAAAKAKGEKDDSTGVAKSSEENTADKDTVDSTTDETRIFTGVIFYHPQNDEYLMLDTEEKFKAFSLSIEKTNALRGKTALAWEQKNILKRNEALEKIREDWNELFEGEVIADSESGIEELILVKQNRSWGKVNSFVHIPKSWKKNGKKIPGKWAKYSEKALQNALDELLKEGKEQKESHWEAKAKWQFLESEPKVGQIWPWAKFNKKKKGENWDFSAEAALARYVMGYTGEVSYDLKEGKIAVEIAGKSSFALFEGKLGGKFYLPNRKGIDLLQLLCSEKGKGACRDTNRECCVRIALANEASLFTGVSIGGTLSFPSIDLSKDIKKVKVGAGAEASGLAGAQAKVGLKIAPEWSTESEGEFKQLCESGYEISGIAGLAGELSFKISYERGRFHFHFKSAFAFGLGGKGGWVVEFDVKQGANLIGHLLYSIDYHYAIEITEEAFTAYKDYSFALLVEGKAILDHGAHFAMSEVRDFAKWLNIKRNTLTKIKESIVSTSLQHEIYKREPPESLGQAILTIMTSREESDFDTILDLLKPAESAHAFKWVLRTVSQIKLPPKSNPLYEKLKEDATQVGIKKIEDFGKEVGTGYFKKNGSKSESYDHFLRAFNKLLAKHGMS